VFLVSTAGGGDCWYVILSRVWGLHVTNRQVLGWMIGFIETLCTVLGTAGRTGLSLITHLQFTVGHALGLSVFTSRILATDS
jgi:hypothetical protein